MSIHHTHLHDKANIRTRRPTMHIDLRLLKTLYGRLAVLLCSSSVTFKRHKEDINATDKPVRQRQRDNISKSLTYNQLTDQFKNTLSKTVTPNLLNTSN